MDLALHTTAHSILGPQLVYDPYMLRKPSPHSVPATEIDEACGFVVATISQWEAPWLYW